MSKNIQLGVIFGGKSPEHEVSIITAMQVIAQASSTKYDVVPIYISKTGIWYTGEILKQIESYKDLTSLEQKVKRGTLAPDPMQRGIRIQADKRIRLFQRSEVQEIDVLFPCFHGGLGESGGFQGLFEISEIPYVGPGMVGAITGMDKVLMKQLFERNGVPITKWEWFYRSEFEKNKEKVLDRLEAKLKYSLFVKPANGGSSIGVTKAKTRRELEHAIEVAMLFDRKVIVEEAFEDAREINISVMGNSGDLLHTSVCEEVFSKSGVLTFEDKYTGGKKTPQSAGMASTKRDIPANLLKFTEGKIRDIATTAYRALDSTGLARLDFLIREKSQEYVLLEANTIPGSMSYYLWEASGVPFPDLIDKLVELAKERFSENQKTTTSFENNILQTASLPSNNK